MRVYFIYNATWCVVFPLRRLMVQAGERLEDVVIRVTGVPHLRARVPGMLTEFYITTLSVTLSSILSVGLYGAATVLIRGALFLQLLHCHHSITTVLLPAVHTADDSMLYLIIWF